MTYRPPFKTGAWIFENPPRPDYPGNIVLNELDQVLDERYLRYLSLGGRFCDHGYKRKICPMCYAQCVMKGAIHYLEEELGLKVNREKSHLAPIKDMTFLGYQILRGKIRTINVSEYFTWFCLKYTQE